VLVALLCAAGSIEAAEIHEAAKAGDVAKVAALVAADQAAVNAKDEGGRTPLHWAARGTNAEILALLVEKGADVNAADANGAVPLHSLAARGDAAGIALLLARGADVSRQAADGSSALHHAARGGQLEAIRALVAGKANVESRNAYGRTPLSVAAREMAGVEVVRLLLDLGADIDATDQFGESPLALAAWRGSADVVALLVERKAKLPAAAAARSQLVGEAVATGLDALFFRLLEAGAELPRTAGEGQGLIAAAAEGGSVKIIEALLARGLSAKEPDGSGWTPLHLAADMGRLPAIELLLERGADLNARTVMGQSVVNLAEDNGDDETKAFLVARGAPQGPPAFPVLTGPYLGQKKPGRRAELFAPGIVSGRYGLHAMPAFSPDGTEVFWRVMAPPRTPGYSVNRTVVSRLVDGRWTYPRRAVLAGTELEDVPFFHPQGTALYDMARRPLPGGDAASRGEAIWIWRKGGPDGWSDPKPLDAVVNSVPHHWQFAVDRAGTVYFGTTIAGGAGDSDLYRSRLVAGAYQPPENLGAAINTAAREGLPYVSPDGRTLLFNRDSDIYASFLTKDGAWTKARTLGPEVNTPELELLPSLSPDGAYLFFSRFHRCYWASAVILDELRAAALDAAASPRSDARASTDEPHPKRTVDRQREP